MTSSVKIYQLSNIKNKNNFKRIMNEIKKLSFIKTVNISKSQGVMKIEYNEDENITLELAEESVLKAIRIYEKKANILRKEDLEVYRKVLYLKGLDCGNCASRIETVAKKELNHEKIVVDFATTRFIIETTDKDFVDNAVAIVTSIAHRVDDRIIVNDSQTQKKEYKFEVPKSNPISIAIFIIGLGLLIAGIFVQVNHGTFHGLLEIIKQFHSEEMVYCEHTIVLFICSYICVGMPVLIRFFKSIFKKQFFDENFLTAIASIGALATAHFIESILVLALYVIGDKLQQRAVNHSRKSINELLTLSVKTTKIKINGEIIESEVESVLPDDIIVIDKGEVVSLDGVIVEGKTIIDTKNITGESLNREVGVGDEVLAGTVNMGNSIEIKVSRIYNESMISQIIDSVENASISKAKTETLITKFSKIYTPLVVALAIVMVALFGGISWLRTGDVEEIYTWIYRAMVFLVVSCPCSLVISIPLCFFSGIGMSSKKGILVKGGNYLEALSQSKQIVFDKTGTLTKGEFKVIDVVSNNEKISKEEVLSLIVYAEYYSHHPIGVSIVDEYGRDKVYTGIIDDFEDVVGGGVKATINGNKILVGSLRFMKKQKIDVPEIDAMGLVIYLARERNYIGYIVVGDSIRDDAIESIQELRRLGIEKSYIFTGDSKGIAENVANRLGIDEVYSELLPNQKVEKLEEVMSKDNKHKTIFVGDGINDAPVISKADVGIAMASSAADATIAIADIVIVGDDLDKLVDAYKISKKIHRKVIQNIILCLGVKIVVMLLTAIPNITVPLWLAIISDVGLSLIAISNSILIDQRKFKKGDKNAKK